MEVLSASVVESAGGAVELAIGLVGMMALFLGLMKVAEAGGILTIIAKTLRPVMVRLFPEVPPNHPAMGAIILNMSANALGLGNAATPFGIRAMQELNTLNPHKGTASNAMVVFLAINTSAVALLPTGIISLRASAGSADPAAILPTTLFATCMSTVVAITAAKLYQRFAPITPVAPVTPDAPAAWAGPRPRRLPPPQASTRPARRPRTRIRAGVCPRDGRGADADPTGRALRRPDRAVGDSGLLALLLTFGVVRGVHVYEVLVEGAREGFQVALRIIPYLVAILMAVAMLRASGALDVLVGWLSPVTSLIGLPGEALPVALVRPLSGTGAFGVVAATIQDPAIGPDS